MFPSASLLVTLGIPALALLVFAVFLSATARALPQRFPLVATLSVGWLLVTGAVAASGALLHFEARPPPFALVAVGSLGTGILIGRSQVGMALAQSMPLWGLVAFQSFRLPLELVMHCAATEGTMPVEMSYSGYNFDIVTGASAILVAIVVKRGGASARAIALGWNVMGSVLLAIVIGVAIAGTPIFHAFGEGAHVNTWVAYFPFVWLPAVLVSAALAGHIIVFRKLMR